MLSWVYLGGSGYRTHPAYPISFVLCPFNPTLSKVLVQRLFGEDVWLEVVDTYRDFRDFQDRGPWSINIPSVLLLLSEEEMR